MVKIGMVGAGVIAQAHLKTLKEIEQAEVVAICDIVKESSEKMAQEYGGTAYIDFDSMLEQEKLDALFLCVPPFAHGEMEEKAAARGIHLLVEKPLGLDMEVVMKKAEFLRKSNIIVSSGYVLRYLDIITKAKEYLQDKEISMMRVHRINVTTIKNPWWTKMSKSGGQLVEQTTHNVDMIRDLAGNVKKVYADMGLTAMTDVPGMDIPDVASVNLVFESGAIGHVVTTCVDQPSARSGLEVMGRGYCLTINGKKLTIEDQEGTRSYENETNPMMKQDETFIQAILANDSSKIISTYEEAMKTLEVTLAANASARSGLPVMINN